MTFLHSNCEFEIYSLQYNNNKSDFVGNGNGIGKIKPIGLEDRTFNLSEVEGDTYKITTKGDLRIEVNERIEVLSPKYLGNYSVKDVKKYEGISFVTTKILLVKI